MENRVSILNKYFAKADIGGMPNVLNAQTDDMAFHKRYQELQVMANLGDYQEFLKEKYFL
ncbi:MAG: hypothetical protein K0S44_1410 [Bacteroidetes bacterium]|nr:hypothetical protein [Bacteroidota bacterium]